MENDKKFIEANDKFVQIIKKLKQPSKNDDLNKFLKCLETIDEALNKLAKSRGNTKTELKSKMNAATNNAKHATNAIESFIVTNLVKITQNIQDKSSFLSSDDWQSCIQKIGCIVEDTLRKEKQLELAEKSEYKQLQNWWPTLNTLLKKAINQWQFYEHECDKFERLQSKKDAIAGNLGNENVQLNPEEQKLLPTLSYEEITTRIKSCKDNSKWYNVCMNVISVVLGELQNNAKIISNPTSTDVVKQQSMKNLRSTVAILKTLGKAYFSLPPMFADVKPLYQNWTYLLRQYYNGRYSK